jgi:hypothetical protein
MLYQEKSGIPDGTELRQNVCGKIADRQNAEFQIVVLKMSTALSIIYCIYLPLPTLYNTAWQYLTLVAGTYQTPSGAVKRTLSVFRHFGN